MNESGTSLQDLRNEIDAIDAEMHGLIMRRAALVERIRMVKARDSVTTVRPGREADIMRALATRHDSNFPFPAIARIWREIIANITRMEMPEYAVAVYPGAGTPGCWDLARDQFGSATPMTAFGSAREVLGEVSAKNATVGVLPCPREGDNDPWWINLAVQDGLRVSYRLPFSPRVAAPGGEARLEAFAVGRIVLEESANDRSLIVIETSEALSRAGLSTLLGKAQITGQPIASHNGGGWYYLIEADGFFADADPRLEELGKLEAVDRCMVVGAYATPLDGSEVPKAGL